VSNAEARLYSSLLYRRADPDKNFVLIMKDGKIYKNIVK